MLLGLNVATAVRAADSWPMNGRNAQATRYNPDEHTLTPLNVRFLHLDWSVPAAAVVPVQGVTYAVVNCQIVSLDTATGVTRRVLFAGVKPNCPAVLAYGSGELIAATASETMAFNVLDGREIWHIGTPATWLAVEGPVLYTGAACPSTANICGKQYSMAVGLATGRALWRINENYGGQPVLIAGHLFRSVGDFWGETRVYDPSTGQLLGAIHYVHAFWTGDAHSSYALVSRGPEQASWLGKINVQGKPDWQVQLGKISDRLSAPALAYHTLFVPSNRHTPGVIAVNAANGRVLWGADLGPDLRLAVANHMLFALQTSTGRISVLSVATGRVLLSFRASGYRRISPTDIMVAGGDVLILHKHGVVALRA